MTLFVGIFATSCNNSNNDDPLPPKLFYDIATLEFSNEEGSTFTLRQENDSPIITLTFPGQTVNTEQVPLGTRVLIAYYPESGLAYTSGQAKLYAIGYVYNSEIEEGNAESTKQWQTMAQNMLGMWRTGNWINIQTQCTYVNNTPMTYDLVVDETTLDEEYPQAYIIYIPTDAANALTRDFYATFDISSVWNRPNVKGLRIRVVENNGPRTYSFIKNQSDPITPTE